MIERHYGKWMGGDDSVQLAKIGEGRETASPPPSGHGDGVPISRGKPGSKRVVSGTRSRR